MTAPNAAADQGNPSPEELQSALFAYLVMQQSNMAMMLMGRTPHPETGQSVRDLDAAKIFIDQLEMLEAKTKGNLNKEETSLLKQTLMTLRMSFVDATNAPEPAPGKAEPAKEPDPKAAAAPSAPQPAEEEEHRTKFSKKY